MITADVLDRLSTGIIVLAAPAANLFPVVYSRRPWRASFLGRALMLKASGIAALIDVTLLFHILGDYPGRHVLRLIIFAMVGGGIWLQFISLLRAPQQRDLSDEHEHEGDHEHASTL